MAATELMQKPPFRLSRASVLSALLAVMFGELAGLPAAQADTPPERGVVAFKYLDYQDKQPGIDRISVNAPSLMFAVPVNEQWLFSGTHTVDTVSGASPRYHSEATSMTRMEDKRRGNDLRITRYFPQGSLTVGASHSRESDYLSRSLFVQGSVSTEDKNSTLNFGLAGTRDVINPSNQIVVDEHKSINELMLGVTQVVSQRDIVQLNYTRSQGRGYFSDPYKFFDNRPRNKNADIVLLRWNHHIEATDASLRLAYRRYLDSFGIRSHTLSSEYVQPLAAGWTVSPFVRLYTQSAASFYYGPVSAPEPTIPDGFMPGAMYLSEDQRLSSYGARALGFKLAKWLGPDVLVDFRYEHYRQRSEWAWGYGGSSGIAPLSAQVFQFGLSYFF